MRDHKRERSRTHSSGKLERFPPDILTLVLHKKGRSHLYIFHVDSFSAFDEPSFLVYSRYTHMRAYQN